MRRIAFVLVVLAPLSLVFLTRPAHAARPGIVPQGWPKLVTLPRLRIAAPVEDIPFTHPKDYEAPFRWGDVAWYDLGPRPGDLGRATVFGHLDSYCCPAVFYPLRAAKAGDVVQVTYRSGQVLHFRVMWTGSFLNSKIPAKFIWGRTSERGLVLMTCTGVFHRDGSGYDHKFIAYARLVLPNGKLG